MTAATVYHGEIPSASAAGRYRSFAFRIVSLHEETRYGSSITASSIPAASTHEPVCTPAFRKSLTSTRRPTKP